MIVRISFIFLLTAILVSCQGNPKTEKEVFSTGDLNEMNRKLLEVAMEDGFPPPIASRVYVYPHIAHYLTLQAFYPDSLPDIVKALHRLTPIRLPGKENAVPELTALLAFCKTAQKLVFSEFYMTDLAASIREKAGSKGYTAKEIAASDQCAGEVSRQLAAWFAGDNYIATRTMDRFTSTKKPGAWIETPPDYMPGLEPHWMKIKPLVIDSVSIFPAEGPPPFDAGKNSAFYKMVWDVYTSSQQLDSVKTGIAWFWDDNPNVTEHKGHLVTMTHKISPPGHWLHIIHQVSTKEKSNLFKTTRAYTFSAIAMFDAILSCWYEKYKTNLVRPVTYIQENIDVNWKPLIQTPPFPEYTSGHSAISAAAATVLTAVFGDHYAFTDSTEVLFNLPVRHFSSFLDAAQEVSLSRFYGGIHYRLSVDDGNKQGIFIANHILEKLK